MKIGAIALSVSLAFAISACSRHRQEAIKLSNEGDQIVDLDPNGAIQRYEQAIQLDPTNHHILYKLAKAHKKKEEWDKVASRLGQATDVAPSFANYWFERGFALEMQAEKGTISYDESKQPYQKCIEADPNKDECYSRLGIASLWTDKEQEALQYFTKAIEFRPDNIGYYTRLADLYIRLDYAQEAEQVLNAAKEMANPNEDKKELYNVHTLLAKIHRDRDDVNKMVSDLEAAKAITQEDAGLLFNLGMAYSKLKPPKKAEALQMLKGFDARACKSAKAAASFKSECTQTQAAIQKLQGAGS
jgi:tetratricopeptide (TPR) repeat protein